MPHTLRNFDKKDQPSVKELILFILEKEYPFDRSAYSDTDLDRIGEVYGGDRETFFVIEDDNKIVGTVGIKREGKDEALLRRLFVHPDYRHHGYGAELVKSALSFCKDNGYKHIYFRCTGRMKDAMHLCVKNGFKEKEALEVSGFKIHKLHLSL